MKQLRQSVMSRFMRVFGYELIKLNFRVEPRANGRVFLSSSDLPGFSLMLDPEDIKDLPSLSAAIYEPLAGYLDMELNGARKPRISGIHGVAPGSDKIVADLCYA